MHTAAHVLSKVIFDETRAVITGNQIGEDRTRIDFALDDFDRDKVQSWVDEANRIISESREVRIEFLNREEAMKIPDFVRQPDLIQKIDTLRIVNIKDLDIQPCGGAHVRNLKEIGGIRLLKTENKGKSNRRVYFSLD
jgi:misacylated tRNA(Ala) deacylase